MAEQHPAVVAVYEALSQKNYVPINNNKFSTFEIIFEDDEGNLVVDKFQFYDTIHIFGEYVPKFEQALIAKKLLDRVKEYPILESEDISIHLEPHLITKEVIREEDEFFYELEQLGFLNNIYAYPCIIELLLDFAVIDYPLDPVIRGGIISVAILDKNGKDFPIYGNPVMRDGKPFPKILQYILDVNKILSLMLHDQNVENIFKRRKFINNYRRSKWMDEDFYVDI